MSDPVEKGGGRLTRFKSEVMERLRSACEHGAGPVERDYVDRVIAATNASRSVVEQWLTSSQTPEFETVLKIKYLLRTLGTLPLIALPTADFIDAIEEAVHRFGLDGFATMADISPRTLEAWLTNDQLPIGHVLLRVQCLLHQRSIHDNSFLRERRGGLRLLAWAIGCSAVSLQEVADACNVSVATVRCWIYRGDSQPLPAGYAAINELLQSRKIPSMTTAEPIAPRLSPASKDTSISSRLGAILKEANELAVALLNGSVEDRRNFRVSTRDTLFLATTRLECLGSEEVRDRNPKAWRQ